jgi:hypothetical protein
MLVVQQGGKEFEAVNEGETQESLMELFPSDKFDSEIVTAPDGDYWLVKER